MVIRFVVTKQRLTEGEKEQGQTEPTLMVARTLLSHLPLSPHNCPAKRLDCHNTGLVWYHPNSEPSHITAGTE